MKTRNIGIYKIESIINPNKKYIGSSIFINSRKSQHFCKLRKNIHDNPKLQNHYNKYGKEDLIFEIIEMCDENELLKKEQYYIDVLKPWFNIRILAESNIGIKKKPCSEETKEKISKSNMGKKSWNKGLTRETDKRIKTGNGFLNKYHTEETKLKMSKVRIGIKHKPMSEETKLKISISHVGKHASLETKKKISDRTSGSSNGMYGKHHTLDTILKLRNNNCKKIINIVTGIVYPSITQAAKENGLTKTCLIKRLSSKNCEQYNLKYFKE
jgi:group I intron endonuclease